MWPIAFLGQLLVALTFAEISTHYPLAGPSSSGRSVPIILSIGSLAFGLASAAATAGLIVRGVARNRGVRRVGSDR